MDQANTLNIEAVISLLKETFGSNTTQQVRAAESKLNELTSDPKELIDCLIKIVSADSSQVDNAIKSSAALYINTYITKSKTLRAFSDEEKSYLAKVCIDTIFCQTVGLSTKTILSKALKSVFEMDLGQQIRRDALILVDSKIQESVEEYASSFIVLQAILLATASHQHQVCIYFEKIIKSLILSGSTLTDGILIEIKKIDENNKNEVLQNIENGFKILNLWSLVMLQFTKIICFEEGQNNKKKNLVEKILLEEDLVPIISKILIMQLQTPSQIPNCIISTSDVEEFDTSCNEIKTVILKVLVKIVSQIFTVKNLGNTKNKFIGFIRGDGFQGILQSVVCFCLQLGDKVEVALQDPEIHDCLVYSMAFLTKLTGCTEFYSTFSDYKRQLIMHVCFPLIRVSQDELILFEKNPEQFCLLAVDTCDKQKSKTAKTQAAQFLETICDNIDGATTYTMVMCKTMIEYSLRSDNPLEIPRAFESLTEHIDSVMIKGTEPNIRVETSLTVLAILSYIIIRRSDIMEIFEKLLADYEDYFTNKADELIKSRVCLLLPYYLEVIFLSENYQNQFKNYLAFLVKCMTITDPKLQAVVYQATDGLCTLFDDEDLTKRLGQYVTDVIQVLIHFTAEAKLQKFFDIIYDIFFMYESEIRKDLSICFAMIKALVERCVFEMENNGKRTNIYINKIWNIFKTISSKKEFVLNLLNETEDALIPLFSYMDSDAIIPFEDDVIKWMNTTMKITRQPSKNGWIIFETFPKVFQKNKYVMGNMIKTLNYMTVYGRERICDDPKHIKNLIKIGVLALNPTHSKANDADCADGAVLLQLVFQYLRPIEMADWEELIIAVMTRSLRAQKSFLKARLAGVILMSFLSSFEITLGILSSNKMLDVAIDLILKDLTIYELDSYDRKLFVISLCEFFNQNQLPNEIVELFPRIFDSIVTILIYSKLVEQKIVKEEKLQFADSDAAIEFNEHQLMMNLIKGEAIGTKPEENAESEIGNSDDEDDEEGNDEEAEAKSTMDFLISDFKAKDEYGTFREFLFKLKSFNQETLMAWISNMPKSKKDYLSEIISSKRIVSDANDGTTEIRKIVKTRAKKN